MSAASLRPLTSAPAIEEEKRQLLQEMKVTKGSRFNAAERLGRRDRLINQMTAFVSGCVIIVTLLPVYFQVGATATSVVSFATIAFSIFILAMSLLQYSNSDPVRAEQHHRCALEINGLRRELRSSQISTHEELLVFTRQFDEILQKYSVNHETIDFDRYKQEHPDEYPELETDKRIEKVDLSIDTSVERLARSSGKIAAAVTAAIIVGMASMVYIRHCLILLISLRLFARYSNRGDITLRRYHHTLLRVQKIPTSFIFNLSSKYYCPYYPVILLVCDLHWDAAGR